MGAHGSETQAPTQAARETPRPAKPPRDACVEALRLVAIAGIACFHTFQPWFSAASCGSWAASAPTLWALGLVSLLGSFGNHVFFLVSGLFLVPAAAKASERPGFWSAQARRTGRRVLSVLVSVALWAAVALAVDVVVPLAGVGLNETGWLVGGLEFIWVYLALMVATPVIGWVWQRLPHPSALVAALTVAVFALNAYIAFVSPGEAERSLLEWRKLMSAVSYLVAFLVGGAVGARRTGGSGDGVGSDGASARGQLLGARWPLAAAVVASVAAEGAAALTHDLGLLAALSYKSTSALSFALAVGSVIAVAGPARKGEGHEGHAARSGRTAQVVRWLTPAILGYYIAQSMFSPLWRPAVQGLTEAALAGGGEAVLLAVGVTASVVLLALVLVADRLTRVRLLKALGLA